MAALSGQPLPQGRGVLLECLRQRRRQYRGKHWVGRQSMQWGNRLHPCRPDGEVKIHRLSADLNALMHRHRTNALTIDKTLSIDGLVETINLHAKFLRLVPSREVAEGQQRYCRIASPESVTHCYEPLRCPALCPSL